MRLPKKVMLGYKRYQVEVHETLDRKRLGEIRYAERRILIGRRHPSTGKLQTARQQAHAFWHEVTHGILKDMGHRLEASEEFVDAFSRRLNNVIHTAKF